MKTNHILIYVAAKRLKFLYINISTKISVLCTLFFKPHSGDSMVECR